MKTIVDPTKLLGLKLYDSAGGYKGEIRKVETIGSWLWFTTDLDENVDDCAFTQGHAYVAMADGTQVDLKNASFGALKFEGESVPCVELTEDVALPDPADCPFHIGQRVYDLTQFLGTVLEVTCNSGGIFLAYTDRKHLLDSEELEQGVISVGRAVDKSYDATNAS